MSRTGDIVRVRIGGAGREKRERWSTVPSPVTRSLLRSCTHGTLDTQDRRCEPRGRRRDACRRRASGRTSRPGRPGARGMGRVPARALRRRVPPTSFSPRLTRLPRAAVEMLPLQLRRQSSLIRELDEQGRRACDIRSSLSPSSSHARVLRSRTQQGPRNACSIQDAARTARQWSDNRVRRPSLEHALSVVCHRPVLV